MQLEIIQNDSSIKILHVPEMQNLPEILISGTRAFRRNGETNRYSDAHTHILASNIFNGIDYLTACIALVRASEHLAQLLPSGRGDFDDAFTWRLRCAIEAINFIKNKEKREIEEFLKDKYPEGL